MRAFESPNHPARAAGMPRAKLGRGGTAAGALPVLDEHVPSTGIPASWSRAQKRCYQRLNSWLLVQESRKIGVLFVTLTSSPLSAGRSLSADHRELRRRVYRRCASTLGAGELLHFTVETTEGNGVLHLLWAWRPQGSPEPCAFYLPHRWLSKEWDRVHKAPVVVVKRYRYGSRQRLGRYCVAQYLSDQRSAFVGYRYSRGSFPFPVAAAWARVKAVFPEPRVCGECRGKLKDRGSAALNTVRAHHPPRDRRAMLKLWGDVLQGRCPVPEPET